MAYPARIHAGIVTSRARASWGNALASQNPAPAFRRFQSSDSGRPGPNSERKQPPQWQPKRSEEALKNAQKKPMPEQRWSNRTLIMLATAVGASTFMLGMNQGYSAAKRHALEEVAPGHSEAQHSDLSHLPPAHTTSGVVDTAEQHPKR